MDRRNGFYRFALLFVLGCYWFFNLAVSAPAEEATNTQETWKVTLRLLDPDGKPVAGGKVIAYQETGETTQEDPWGCLNPVDPQEATTGPDGCATISYPKRPEEELYIDVKAEGYVFLQYHFPEEASDEKMATLEVHLSRGEPAGGTVRDEGGKAIEGVKLIVFDSSGDCEEAEDANSRPLPGFILTTDEHGKWACRVEATRNEEPENEPDFIAPQVSVHLSHPDFAERFVHCLKPGETTGAGAFGLTAANTFCEHRGMEIVGKLSFDTVLNRGSTLIGRVVDETGKGIPGVRFIAAGLPTGEKLFAAQTDEKGRFRIEHLAANRFLLIARHDEYAPEFHDVVIESSPQTAAITMKKGRTTVLSVCDQDNNPMQASVSVRRTTKDGAFGGFLSSIAELLEVPRTSDERGNWTWNRAPTEPLEYEIGVPGFRSRRSNWVRGSTQSACRKSFDWKAGWSTPKRSAR